MDDFALEAYLDEVAKQARLAHRAATHVDAALSDVGRDQAMAMEEVFRNIHSLLTHASNVSRLLWPPGPSRRKGQTKEEHQQRSLLAMERATSLRSLLHLTADTHPLRQRTLRDHLEHFDERLDDWQSSPLRHGLLDWMIGPPSVLSGLSDHDRLRCYNPSNAKFIFRGEEFDLKALTAALEELVPVAEREAGIVAVRRRAATG